MVEARNCSQEDNIENSVNDNFECSDKTRRKILEENVDTTNENLSLSDIVKVTPENIDEAQLERCKKMGIDVDKVLMLDDLVKGDDAIFAATAVTDTELLRGVQYKGAYALTHSVVMRAKTGTVRFIEGRHSIDKKPKYAVKS